MPALQKKHKKSSVHNIKSVMNTRYVLNDRNRYTLKIRNFKGWGGFTAFWPYDFTIHSPQNHFLRVTKIDTHYFV